MSNEEYSEGSCLCGAISITAERLSRQVGACHCSSCRKWGGGPFMTTDCGTQVKFTGEQNVAVYSSSEWAERGFCRECGTHLFYRLKESQQYIMPVGLFSEETQYEFDHQVFIDEKPQYYEFANDTENMTGAEVFAKYGAS